MNWIQAQQTSLKLRQKRMLLEAQKTTLEEQRKRNLDLSMQAQDRIQSDDLVKEILERVQQREHERAVGAYEQLLGAFLSDVLPGERQIVMDLHTDRSAPALDIYIKKGENMPLEDAWLGTGGSVTNLLSTGLRLVSLLRSDQRRFLVLDESDCWIKPTLIPQYASMVHQMSKALNVQILMISHHEESLFAQHIPNRLRLTRNKSSLLMAEWSPTSDIPHWSDNDTGLRYIGLKDFQSHQNTLIPLAPSVTLLQGDNDIGKSAVVNALRAVFDADANDTLIKHHAPFAQVTLDFGPDNLLVWQRFRKGKVKCSYKLLDRDTNETLHATDGTRTPQWLIDTFKIGKIDGLDIQIGQQQDPVFLLNQPASVRAKALSIGQESGHINNMMLLDRQELQESKSLLKRCERDLEEARRKIMVFNQLSACDYDHLEQQIEQAHQRKDQHTRALTLLQRWKNTGRAKSILDQTPSEKLVAPDQKSLQPQKIRRIWDTAHKKYTSMAGIESRKNLPSHIPQLTSLTARRLLGVWLRSNHFFTVLKNTPQSPIQAPEQRSIQARSLLNRWESVRNRHILSCAITSKCDLPKDVPQPQAFVCHQLHDKWSATQKRINVLLHLHQQTLNLILPRIHHYDHLLLLDKWQLAMKRFLILQQKSNARVLQEPLRKVNLEHSTFISLWTKHRNNHELLKIKHQQLQFEEQKLEKSIQQQFPVCPTCQRAWTNSIPEKDRFNP